MTKSEETIQILFECKEIPYREPPYIELTVEKGEMRIILWDGNLGKAYSSFRDALDAFSVDGATPRLTGIRSICKTLLLVDTPLPHTIVA